MFADKLLSASRHTLSEKINENIQKFRDVAHEIKMKLVNTSSSTLAPPTTPLMHSFSRLYSSNPSLIFQHDIFKQEDIVLEIFHRLDYIDLCSCTKVSSYFREYALNSILWQNHCFRFTFL